jgi:hypothetical protein
VKHAVQRGIGVPTQHLLKGPRKTTEILGRVGWSQDLPEANWLLASSPEFARPNWYIKACSKPRRRLPSLPQTLTCARMQTHTSEEQYRLLILTSSAWKSDAQLQVLNKPPFID